MKPSAVVLRAISDAPLPPHRRVRALLKAHGLPHGRRARRRFYRQLRRAMEAAETARDARGRPVFDRVALRAMAAMTAAVALACSPAWLLRWLAVERPWRHPRRWEPWPRH